MSARATELIVNGGFESGSTGWVFSGTPNGAAASSYGSLAHSGSYYLWMGGAVSESDAAYQTITIPSTASAATLSFYYNINSSEPTTSACDTFYAAIGNTSGVLVAVLGEWSNLNGTSPGNPYYYQQTYNLLTYAGQTIRIYFINSCTGSKVTNFRVDDVSVSVTTASTGSLQVSITPAGAISAGAQWQVDGGTWESSGATVSGLSVGSHTVSFSTVSGWTTPANQNISVSANSTATATGTYVSNPQTGSLQVTISPTGAVSAGAKWQVDSGTWQSSGATVSGLSVGSHTVSFSTVSGWTTPANQNISVSANSTATATGTYGTQSGSLQVTISPAGAISAGANWQVDGGTWQSSSATVSGLSVGSHTVSFSTVSGWTTPANQNVSVSANSTATATGTYGTQNVLGADFNVGAGSINWQQETSTSPSFLVIKAAQGDNKNSFLPSNMSGVPSVTSGFTFGVYHYADPDEYANPSTKVTDPSNSGAVIADAQAAANSFYQIASTYLTVGHLQPALDLEDEGGYGGFNSPYDSISGYPKWSWSEIAEWIAAWTTQLQQDDPSLNAPILYMTQGYAQNISPQLINSYLTSPISYHLWVADINDSPNIDPSPSIGSWPTWAIEQYDWPGTTPPGDLDALNSSTTLSSLEIPSPQTGSLQVTISPAGAISAGAQWQVDGGTLQSSGATVGSLSVGSHTVSFSTVSGWTTPANQNVSVSANSTATATGTYVVIPQTGSLQVTISPAGAISAGAQWQVDGGTLQSSGATVGSLSVGSHTVSFSTVSGWTTPANQNISVSANSTATVTGTYTASPLPANDNFANRIVLSGMVLSTTGWNTNATKESGEPNHAGGTGGKSVWWSWVAPSTGTVTVSTAGSSFDTLLGLYTGSAVSSLTTIASNDDANGSVTTSLLTAPVVAGTEYEIAVDGYGGAFGSIDLSISLVLPPPTAPSIIMCRVGNQLVLCWGTNWPGYVLQSAKALGAGASWDQVSSSVVVVGATNMVTNTMSRSALFYRLKQQ